DAFSEGTIHADTEGEIRRNWANRIKLADAYAAQLAETFASISPKLERNVEPLDLSSSNAPGWPDQPALARFRDDRVELFRRMFGRILGGLHVDAAGLFALIDELIDKLVLYPERFTQLALLTPRKRDYLPDHAYTTAVLAIAIAARMGCCRADVRLAGMSGLVCDLGMGLIPRDIRTAKRKLNEIEINRIHRHPAFSVVLLDEVADLPDQVRMAALQHHERDNATGYPSRLRAAKICDLARIVAVADNFAAATEPRPYKHRKKPYDAIEELIVMGSQHVFDRRVVRALVESCGLFPVGSYVRLSTSEIAVVIGAHADNVDRPIVRVAATDPSEPPETRDLKEYEPWELSVISAVEAPPSLRRHLRAAG
ncbi:MAG: HD domain-containing protein, partial [Phycisphaerales bacterium]|nr:HD domain-containing protein [Phycisphaerales bacterium]